MTPLDVVFSEQADEDIAAIYQWVGRDRVAGNSARLRFADRRPVRGDRRGAAGRARDDLAPGTRTVPFERSALIAYRVENERVVITNIFYRGRDVGAAFVDDI